MAYFQSRLLTVTVFMLLQTKSKRGDSEVGHHAQLVSYWHGGTRPSKVGAEDRTDNYSAKVNSISKENDNR